MDRPQIQQNSASKSGLIVYQEITSLSKKLITAMLVRMIEGAGDYHSWSLSDADGTRLVKLIKHKQRMICSSFTFQLKKNFKDFESASQTTSAEHKGRGWQKIGLVGANSTGETEELQNISNRYSDAFREFDKTILKRLQHCVRRSRAHVQDSPLQVKRLCESFQYAIDSLNLEVSCKVALYHLFANRFIESLGPFYRKIDRALIEQGMVEELTPARIHLRSIEGLSESRPPISLQLNSSATLLGLLQQFKERSRHASGQYKNLFGELKQQFIRHGMVENTDKIDQVNMLFKLIFQDEDLPEPVKLEISRLQIYVMITALQENSFFKQSSNPVRRLLDCIVVNEAEIARSGKKEASGIDFIHSNIDEFTTREFISLDSYREVLEGYQKFLQQKQGEAQTARKSEAAKKLLPAIKSRLAELTRPLKDLGRPSILFDKVWMPLLVQIALKQGMQSEAWDKSLLMVKTQVWSLTPKSTKEELAQLNDIQARVAHSLHRAMRSLKLPEKLQQSLRDYLKLEQQDVLDKTRRMLEESHRKTRSLAAQSFESSKESDEFSEMMQTGMFQVTPEMLEALNAVKPKAAQPARPAAKLNKGDWVQVRQADQIRLAKLAWKSDDDSLFIFIDRDGQRVCEVDADTLDRRLESGDISPVNTGTVSTEKTQFSIMRSL